MRSLHQTATMLRSTSLSARTSVRLSRCFLPRYLRIKHRWLSVGVATMLNRLWFISAVANVLLGGKYPETLCSRAWRNRHYWWFRFWYRFWNQAFCNRAHCAESHLNWRNRMNQQLELDLGEKRIYCANPRCHEEINRKTAYKTVTEDYCSKTCAVAHNLDRLAQDWD
jgi:hypothetical protein